ncbi:MAG: phage tail protein, partial [Monoglobus pectinilyticus]
HVVKVEGIQEVSLKIGTILALQPDWKLDDIKESVTEVVDNYFTELAALWEDTENLVVRKSQIETRLLDLEGVADVFNTTIQDKEENYTLGKFDIPVREGEITIEEKTD